MSEIYLLFMSENKKLQPLNTDGAELLTLGNLLLRGILAFKAYKNQEGWDIICLSDDRSSQKTIQVKYRSNYTNMSKITADFLVFVNRENNLDCDIYIIPQDADECWTQNGITSDKKILQKYKDNWDYIISSLR